MPEVRPQKFSNQRNKTEWSKVCAAVAADTNWCARTSFSLYYIFFPFIYKLLLSPHTLSGYFQNPFLPICTSIYHLSVSIFSLPLHPEGTPNPETLHCSFCSTARQSFGVPCPVNNIRQRNASLRLCTLWLLLPYKIKGFSIHNFSV